MDKNNYIFGIHAVMEAIEAGKEIDKILIKKNLQGEASNQLFSLIRERGIYNQIVPVEKLNRITMKNHQGVIAQISEVTYYSLDDVVPQLYEDGKLPLLLVLDGITDVRNFGAIARTAESAGVDAIIIQQQNSVSVNADAVKTSAGALHYIPVCREKKLSNAVQMLKDNGYKIIGASEKGSVNYTKLDYTVPVAIVMGAEDTGISPAILRMCDDFASIPQFGAIKSLNVSVAAAVIMYEAVRQRLEANFDCA